jgi:hypothetical protein
MECEATEMLVGTYMHTYKKGWKKQWVTNAWITEQN